MANKFYKRSSFLIILIIGAFNLIFAQSSKHVFSQKLEWKSDPNAIEYKVEIKNTAGKITTYKTEKTYINFSLPSGDYEWRVTAYDFLGRSSRKTEWEKFTIKKAIEPAVKTTEEKIIADDPKQISIPVQAEKIQPNAKIELVNSKTKKTIPGEIKNDTAVFEKVPEGDYKVRVTNPCGLSSETSVITVKDKAAEEKRLAEEKKRLEEEKRIAEENRIAEEKRLAEEKKQAEEQAKLAKAEEQKRLEEEKRTAEENCIAEEKRLAEEKKLAEQQKREEEKRLVEEKKKAEEQAKLAKAEEKKRLAEEKKLAEQQKKEEEKRLAEEKKKAAEQAKLAKAEEKKRLAEEKKLAEQQKKEEEKRLAEEKKKAAEQAKLAKAEEKKRLAEEKKLAEQQKDEEIAEEIPEEASPVKEKRKNRSPSDVYILGGANAVINLSNSEIFLDKQILFGAGLKLEILPFSIGKFKLGFNIETNPTPLQNKTSFIDEFMLFVPLNVNVSLFVPIIQEKISVGFQAGGGGIGVWHTAKFSEMEDESLRDNVNSFYVNYMYDAGVVLRFYLGKRFVADVTAEFDSWRIGGYNLTNVLVGAKIGLRL